MEATAQPDNSAPARRLAPRQRETLIAYARLGDQRAAADYLGISVQTVKNHLSDAYIRLGVKSGTQAVYVLLGGESAVRAIPAPSDDLTYLRRQTRILERTIERQERVIARYRERWPAQSPDAKQARARDVPMANARTKSMVDGEITLGQLESWSRRFDADAHSTSEARISCREWVALLKHYIDQGATGLADTVSG